MYFVKLDTIQQFFILMCWDALFVFCCPNGIAEGSRFRTVLGTVLLKIIKFFQENASLDEILFINAMAV